MANLRMCDICDQPFKEGQVGSVRLRVEESPGIRVKTDSVDICKNCNPFLKAQLHDVQLQLHNASAEVFGQSNAGNVEDSKVTDSTGTITNHEFEANPIQGTYCFICGAHWTDKLHRR